MPSKFATPSFLLHCCLWIPCSVSLSTTSSLKNHADLGIDVSNLQETINQGRVYQVIDFFSEQEVLDLLQDMDRLEANGSFQRSGLSNTVKGKTQNFGSQDRYTCVVPWWDRVLTFTGHNDDVPSHVRKLVQLKALLATALNRPTMMDSETIAHECYYSKSLPHSTLKRHMDERHEEFKQAKGWLLPSRRSISWLVYLSDEPWTLDDNGGALRAFPQKSSTCGKSTHDGNLQVGWWASNDALSKPVYLNSWFPLIIESNSPPEPHCVLYVVNDNDTIRFLTNPWPNDVLLGMSTADFILLHQKELFRDEEYKNFYLIEDRAAWDAGEQPHNSHVLDVAPLRRSLVMFDSVSVPHEVMPIMQGTRRALAGWFHEQTQPIPEQYFLA